MTTLRLFEQRKVASQVDLGTLLEREERDQPQPTLNCVHCQHRITTPAARIAIDDRHEHTFSNPHGFTFRIGCFSEASGAVAQGDESGFWTWFSGYRWQIALCRQCSLHLGWRYRNGSVFYGLILDRLVEQTYDSSG